MRTRLTLIVLALVILPTALLSLAAGRLLKDWETALQRRLERNAVNAVVELSSRLRAQTDSVMGEVRSALTDCLSRGGGYEDIARAAAALQHDNALIAETYLFMNPFGFVYPRQTGPDEERLIQALRPTLAAEPHDPSFTLLRDDPHLYVFAPLQRREGLFVGWRIEPHTFNRRLTSLVTLLSDADFTLTASGPGLTEPAAPASVGTASHILTSEIAAPATDTRPAREGEEEGGRFNHGEHGGTESEGKGLELRNTRKDAKIEEFLTTENAEDAEGFRFQPSSLVSPPPATLIHTARLAAPFDFIEVTVQADDPARFRQAGAWQARLAGWGIVLLAGVIALGAVLMVREAGAEIRRARDRSDFVMSVSHDLRTPVASMKMLAESLYLDTIPDPAKRKIFLSAIVSECDRLADIVERVLFFMRQERQALAYVFSPCEPGPILEDAVALFQQRRTPSVDAGAAGGGTWNVEGGTWNVERGTWNVEGGTWNVECDASTTEEGNHETTETTRNKKVSEQKATKVTKEKFNHGGTETRRDHVRSCVGAFVRSSHPDTPSPCHPVTPSTTPQPSSQSENSGPGTNDQGPRTKDQGPRTKDYSPLVALDIRSPLPMILADRDMLIKLVLNLLDNAVKYGLPSSRNSHYGCSHSKSEHCHSERSRGISGFLRRWRSLDKLPPSQENYGGTRGMTCLASAPAPCRLARQEPEMESETTAFQPPSPIPATQSRGDWLQNENGSASPPIVVTARAETRGRKRGVLIAVRDAGPGVAPRNRRRIFRKFYRTDPTRPGTPGVGLGLSICRDIARAHRGRIAVAAAPGGGAEFRVWLPAEDRGV